MFHFFGIRHHGPGSAKSLVMALNELNPDLILLESPEECDAMYSYITNPELKPPVAILVYNPKDLQQSLYYPFTEFSPEWQAIKYSNEKNIPVVSFDLPVGFAFDNKKEEKPKDEDSKYLESDPLSYFAKLAGYEDVERWWEVNFENQLDGKFHAFEKIEFLMIALREDSLKEPDNLREAYMRKVMRSVKDQGYKNIAVVCGAWHVPALDLEKFKQKEDNNLLSGLKKIKTQSTWIPWTYERISVYSGYGAGVISPSWYELLFKNHENASVEWLAKAAQISREHNMDISSSHVIEAVRLAETLSSLRALLIPGINELFDAIKTVFSAGDDKLLSLIERNIIVGDKQGEVPVDIDTVPLQQDIERKIKNLRLSKYQVPYEQDIKKEGLDLRNEFDRNQSVFLHQLNLINIDWGNEKDYSGREKTTFKEYWTLKWRPEFYLKIIESAIFGNDLETASKVLTIKTADELKDISSLCQLLFKAIKAKIDQGIDLIISKLNNQTALSDDLGAMMDMIPELVQIKRYGDVRKSDLNQITLLIDSIIPRICIALPSSTLSINEENAKILFNQIISTHQSILLYNDQSLTDVWFSTINSICELKDANRLVQGLCTRLLFDLEFYNLDLSIQKLQFALSETGQMNKTINWLEGFLHGPGIILIHHPKLLEAIDSWIDSLNSGTLQNYLPVLRRIFSKFSKPEKEKIIMLSSKKNGQKINKIDNVEFDKERLLIIQSVLNKILKE